MTELFLIAPLILLLVASINDVKTREIPDWISVVLVAAALGAARWEVAGVQFWMVATGGVLGLAIGAALFRFARFGGGDAKLIAAIGALLGPIGLFFLLFWMALAGGVLALIAINCGRRDYAYVPAIAAGYVAYLIWPVGMLGHILQ